jgi:hypothetical protein
MLLAETDRIIWLAMWMLISCAVIVYNKWVFTAGGFPYPLALTCMHMTTCFVVFGSIRKFAPQSIRTFVMPDADVVTPWDVFIKNFVLISVFYAGTLGTGQMAYLFASVPFIQMMKPMNIIFASIAAFIVGVEVPTYSHVIIVCIIAFGISVATGNAAEFSAVGAVLQVVSSASEGCRLALVQTVTTTGMKLDPVSTVYHFSFTSAVLLAIASFLHERPYDFSKLLSPWVLVLNCAMAVILNILVATVIKKTSAVTFTLGGIVKDMGVFAASAYMFTTPITRLMVCGYAFSLSGICMYKVYKDNLELFKQVGFLQGMSTVGGQAKAKLRSSQ